MTREQMVARLAEAFPDAAVEVIDTTGTEDHWDVSIQSAFFAGLPRIRTHQAVMAVFANELKSGDVHALSIRATAK